MKNLTIKNLTEVCSGTYHGPENVMDREVSSITTDSRKIEKDSLFVPIVGERVDAHRFIPDVMSKGALVTLSERELENADFPYIQVGSSLQAVKDIAEFYLKQLQIPVVGITGSVGKTSTKEVIASVLAQKYNVLKTLGNFNNELGLPLTVFRLRDEHQIAVLEMGISHFGEMHRLAKVARPDICVITNIGQCHLEFLKDRDGILRAKTEIFDFLKEDGCIILNGDDDKLDTIEEVKGIKPIFFGVKGQKPVYADEIESLGLSGIACTIHADGESIRVTVPIPGWHMVLNALAATAVGRALGLTMQEIKAGIEALEPVGGRFHIINHGDIQIIDDCYNANPVSMKSSIEVLSHAKGRTIAVLGDMGELGSDEKKLHHEVGEAVGENHIHTLFAAGELAKEYAAGAAEKSSDVDIHYFEDRETMTQELLSYVKEGDTILVKASHFMEFPKVVEALSK